MIDYAKIEIPPEYGSQLEAHPRLSFRQPVDVQTGEYEDTDTREAEYRGMIFTIYPSGRITLHGSWHKYFHGGTNWQDFSLTQFREAVREFCYTFDLDPTRLQLLQLEAGVNVTPPLPTRETLRAFVCNGKGNAFGSMRSDKGQPLGLELYLTDYGLKVYNKGAQYGLSYPLMRFERKYTNWCKFAAKLGIHSLSDLLHVDAWNKLADHELDAFSGLIIREPSIDPEQLPPGKRLFFADAGRAGYWQEITRKERHKARERLRRIVQDFGTGDLYADLRTLIDAKLRELNTPGTGDKKGDVFHDIPERVKYPKRGRFPTSSNDGKRSTGSAEPGEGERAEKIGPEDARRCRTCGRDISDQRPGSVFCSERLHGRDAKRCRNADSNPRNHDLRKLQRITADPLLFDHRPYLRAIRHYQPQTPTGK